MSEYQSPLRKLARRYLAGALLVIAATATPIAWAAVSEIERVVDVVVDRDPIDPGDEIVPAGDGDPQTILVIGSDKRAEGARDAGGGARSDTLLLVRLDPHAKRTSLLSLPRDLKVSIPGHGTAKINTAYSLGGAKLTLKTVRHVTGLDINHVINVDFGGFREAVDAVGCVYVDIDRSYFNDNVGEPFPYATIDVPQGYQKLCGPDALDYVRYRHEDTDLVRGARQQDFIRQAKAQLGVGKIVSDRGKLTKIFGRYTDSDLDTREEVLQLLRLVVEMSRHPVTEIRFPGKLGPSYVTISDRKMRTVVREFLGAQESKGRKRMPRRGAREGGSNLEIATDAGEQQARSALGAKPGIPVYYPTRRTGAAQYASPAPRVYDIAVGKKRYRSYRMTLRRDGALGEYYGLQGTQWKDPPILKGADATKKVGGRTFELFYDGSRVRLVAWRTPEAVYWVSNTLLRTLSRGQMLEIASTARVLTR